MGGRELLRFFLLLADSGSSHYHARLVFGAIAQLGERLHGMQEVGGSIPPGSTKDPAAFAEPPAGSTSSTGSPSSRGLGHRPFTAVTGVRIPVGTPFSFITNNLESYSQVIPV